MKCFFSLLGIVLSSLMMAQSAGSLDLDFGTAGSVSLDNVGIESKAFACALQTDGKIVVGGYVAFADTGKDFAIVRLNVNGTLDESFSDDGVATFDLQLGSDDIAYSIAVQSDGAIVAAGYSDNGSEKAAALIRVNTAGLIDDTFGTNGVVVSDWVAGNDDIIRVLKFHAVSGNLITAGTSEVSSTSSQPTVARYTSSGELDTSFNGNGVVNLAGQPGDELRSFVIEDIEVKSNGKISAVGWKRLITTSISIEWWAGKVNSDGSLDTSFSTDGILTYNETGSNMAYAMELKSNDDLVVVGTRSYFGNNTFRLINMTAAGTIPAVSNSYGFGATTDIAYCMATDNNGNYVLAGTSGAASASSFALIRLNSTYSYDTSFGNSGKVATNFVSGSIQEIHELCIQTDDKIVAVGFANNRMRIARYLGTDQAQLNEFTHLSPANGASNVNFVSVNLDWTDAFGAMGYAVQIDTDPDLLSPQSYSSVASNRTVTNLEPNTTYYWRVSATADNVWGDWSEPWSFNTADLNDFNLVLPTNTAINQAINGLTLDWSSQTGAISYELELDLNPSFNSPQQFAPSSSTYSVSGLNYNTTYYWRVRATNGTVFGDWTSTWSFTTMLNPIGVRELDGSTLSVFPNPVDDHLTIRVSSELIGHSYQLFNGSGVCIGFGKISSIESVISLLTDVPGVYFILLDTGKNVVFVKN